VSHPNRHRVVVCGTGFGRVYLDGLGAPQSPVELAGILARGSERSKACARRWGVPLYEKPEDLPDDISLACVVVSSAINGGPGAQLAQSLMRHGIHVLQEHPLHADELAGCLRVAKASGVHYRVNTHHLHVEPVRRFITAAQELLRRQPALFIDAACGFQVLATVLDILGAILGRLRPWGFAPPAATSAEIRRLTTLDLPFRSLDGVLGGVPTVLRVQNQMDPREPDNHAHLWHRITLGTESGQLTLVSSTGPVLWTVRPHLPRSGMQHTSFGDLSGDHLGIAGTVPLGPAVTPSWAETLSRLWPEAVRTAVARMTDEMARGEDPLTSGQYHLSLCQLSHEITSLLGRVELVTRATPQILAAPDLFEVVG